MKFYELLILAIGLSMDALAVAVCIGLTMEKATLKKSLIVGIYFGAFQAGMPLIGYFGGTLLAERIVNVDHWVAFLLLAFLGGKMIGDSRKKDEPAEETKDNSDNDGSQYGSASAKPKKMRSISDKSVDAEGEASLRPAKMLPLAVATSIDALAVGVSFAFLKVNIAPAVSLIGVTTLIISIAGVRLGCFFGEKFRSKAELIGGIILMLIGFKILLEHAGILIF
ncbi:MAG: manganese efflux pump MntP family protein [Oscillospiraceae bacterium]|nr:manganese efflux pump MntP family protein [Oscillospiraceae bacterium]